MALTLTHKSIILVLRFGSSSPDYRVKIRPKGDGGCEREERGVDGFEDKRERGVPSLPCTCERERCQVLKGF